MKYILGVESTAHTFGVAVVDDKGKILSNVKDSYTTEEGGMIPLEVRKHHAEVSGGLYLRALGEVGISEEDIEAIAFSNAPGLAPCLLEGMDFVKKTARKLGIPMVMVNHCVAHLEIGKSPQAFRSARGVPSSDGDSGESQFSTGKIVGAKDPVMLYASGANTQIIAFAPYGVPQKPEFGGKAGKYRVFGETLDLGVGNFIDTFARFAGLGFPGGPAVEKLAEAYCSKDDLLELPYSIKGMDVAFSGLQTKLKNYLDKKEHSIEKLSYAMQETVFAMLVEAAERALAHTGKKELLLGGGVACNSRLQEMAKIMCEERGVKFFCPERPLLVDNAGMIAYLGWKMFNAGLGVPVEEMGDIDIAPRERTDDVEVSWK